MLLLSIIMICISCKSTPPSDPIYADIVSFSDNVNTYYGLYYIGQDPMYRRGTNDMDKVKTIVQNLKVGQNTAAYYAMDEALDRLQKVQEKRKDDVKTKYYIIMLTDGLDNVSVEMARRNKRGYYNNLDEYGDFLQSKMSEIFNDEKLFGLIKNVNTANSFQAYPLMVMGNDLKQSGYTAQDVKTLLEPLSGAQNEYRPKPLVEESFEDLMESFKNSFVVTSFSFQIPTGYVGKKIRMEMNTNEGNYIVEGDFVFEQDKSLFAKKGEGEYRLCNITSGDLTFDDCSAVLTGDLYGNNVLFTLNNMRLGDKPVSVMNGENEVTQSFYDTAWRKNSEYSQYSDSSRNAYVLFLLDMSKSLRGIEDSETGMNGVDKAKQMTIEILNYIADSL